MGSWYGSILISYLHDKVKKITCIDLDERTLQVAKTYFFPKSDKIEWIAGDLFEDWKTHIYPKTDLFINTSCEHMKPMKEWVHILHIKLWWTRVKKNAHFAFQSNNMYGLKGHINCVKKIENFKEQLPEQFNILVEDEVVETRGTRFTLIGNARNHIKRIQTTNDHLDDAVNFEPNMTCRLKCPACWKMVTQTHLKRYIRLV